MRAEEKTPAENGKKGTTYGYARVSTREQNLDRQLIALAEFGVDDRLVYADKASGKDFERPRYRALMRRLREGDVLVVKSIDRLGRDYEEILEEWRAITKRRKAAVVVLDMPLLDTRESRGDLMGSFVADLVLQLLSYISQTERDSMLQRQAEGIAAAKARGVRFGRPCKQKPSCFPQVRADYLEKRVTRGEASERLGVSVTTFDKWMRE